MTTCTSTLLMLSMASLVVSMDYGSSGVYDSPMATDYYVKRFGFMFGGGRSGMYGLKALQVRQKIQLEMFLEICFFLHELFPKNLHVFTS